jgi:hypothetical protein
MCECWESERGLTPISRNSGASDSRGTDTSSLTSTTHGQRSWPPGSGSSETTSSTR